MAAPSTRTVNDEVPVLPRVSLARQWTVVVPIGKMLPLARSHVTSSVPSTRSFAVGLRNVTDAPLALVAGTTMDAVGVSVGGVVSLLKGYNGGYKGLIPPYVVLTQPQGRFSEAGFLGTRYKPFATGGDPAQGRFAVEGVVAVNISDSRQRARRDYLHRLDTLARAMPGNPELAPLYEAEAQAVTTDAIIKKVFNAVPVP